MPDSEWISDEPRLRSVVARVLTRASYRPGRLVAVALVLTALAVTWRAVRSPMHKATLYYRLSEGELTQVGYGIRPPQDIRAYLSTVALSRAQIEGIMRKYGHSLAWLARDPNAAVAEFRQDLEITVSRNYFVWDRDENDPPRSAEVAISFTGSDLDDTRGIVGEIRDAVLRDQAKRTLQIAAAGKLFQLELQTVRRRAEEVEARVRPLYARVARSSPTERVALEARIAVGQVELQGLLERLASLEGAAAAAEFYRDAEDSNVGVRMELVDEHVETFSPRVGLSGLALRAVFAFAIAALLAALALGAFEDHVYAPGDVAAAGVRVLGVIPACAGDDAGSFRARKRGI